MGPPPCVQNAMMTKDKKPFTYTPGGIDLSEIRSPRMARRIERNANYEGVTDVPRSPQHNNNNIQNLPPSTLAAMNPQIQVQVLPSMPPPPPPPLPPVGGVNPPPPPPMPTQKVNNNNGNQFVERPDMTKIIPDNPMAMLKKTGGPKQRSAFVDEMYATGSMKTPPIVPQQVPEFKQPQHPIIERPTVEQPKSGINLGSLYIPPINQPQQNRVMSPPTPPERQDVSRIQSPGTPPTLKEAPKPWQNRPTQQQHQQIPTWARREDAVQSSNQNGQAMSPQPPQYQHHPAPASPIHIEVRSKQVPVQRSPDPQQQQHLPNAVYVTQPMVLQHPGPRSGPPQHFQHPPSGGGGARIIPIMMEGQQSPNPDRFQRQQSWGNNTPTQSNSFKVIQKLTQTDDNNEQNGNVTEHSARFTQPYQQQDGQENQETDPRYRGAAIPSRAFRMLQNMNDTGTQLPIQQQQQRPVGGAARQPQIRTIPIQIEGNEQPQKYVHPSEQVTPEPKKYMGSSIPSRSFKMLQAMTTAVPDVCANASNVNVENVTTPTNERWTYDHYMPQSYIPLPFYPDYYYYPMPEQNTQQSNNTETTQKTNYLPYWYYYPPSNDENSWSDNEQQQNYEHFHPYCDPYYYYYYYGYYPEMYPIYNSDTDEMNDYSSTDEMLYYSKQFNKPPPTLPQTENYENKDCKYVPGTESDRTDDTDTMVEENTDEDDDEETETEESNEKKSNHTHLQSLPSVSDIKIYENDEQNVESDQSETTTIEKDEEINEKEEIEDDEDDDMESIYDPMPHQLSVIMEETERSSSICNDDETITDLSEDEEEISLTVSLKLPSLKQCEKSDESDEDENEVHATFTITNIATTKKEQSPVKSEEETIPEVVQSDTVLEIKPKTEQIQQKDTETSDSEESDEEENDQNWWSIQPVPKPTTYQPFLETKTQCSTDSLNSSSSPSIENTTNQSKQVELMSIKDRIKALRQSIEAKEKQIKEKRTKPTPIKLEPPPQVIEEPQPTTTTDEPQASEEDEDDSGVTSDIKSDCEDFQELQKFNKYQRAATHSRLFQLLQEVSDDDEPIEEPKHDDKFSKLSVRQKQTNTTTNRQHLSLPLKNINKPTETPPEISDKLVNELIASLLHSKKGQIFRNMPKEKLKCTALRVLQEDMDDQETPSSSGYNSLLSPPRGSTECSSPAQTPQDFYENTSYSDYYDSWDQQQQQTDNQTDVELPSKAFKIIQEQINSNKSRLPKCPRVLSGKNVKKLDNTHQPSSSSHSSPNEVVQVTSAS